MNPILAALEAAAVQLVTSVVTGLVPVLIAWFQKQVLPHSAKFQALPKEELRAQTRTWVLGLLQEAGADILAKLPSWAQAFLGPLLPTLEADLDVAIENGLNSAGL